jgi:3-deoxy-D-manno-octulosonate 8-phosphate phosphatase KdsC-like HAD superfamily phosphatase
MKAKSSVTATGKPCSKILKAENSILVKISVCKSMTLSPSSVSEHLASIRCVVVDMSVLCDAEQLLSLGPTITPKGDFLYIPDKDAAETTSALSFKTYDGIAIRNLFQDVLHFPICVITSDTQYENIYHQRCAAMHVSEIFCGISDKFTFLQDYSQKHGFALKNILLFDRNLSPHNIQDQQLATSIGLLVGTDAFSMHKSVPYVNIAPEPHGYVRGFSHRYLESMTPIQAYHAQTREEKAQVSSKLLSTEPQMIRALILDIDGTCTNACRILSQDGREWKRFCQKDLQALRQWVDSGKILCFLTGDGSNNIVRWAEICRVDPSQYLIRDATHLKVQHLHRMATQLHLQLGEIAYMGDDTNDLGVLEHIAERNGFAACPQNAVPQILAIPGIHLMPSYGGNGACADMIAAIAGSA